MQISSTAASAGKSITPTAVFRYKQRYPLNAIFEPKSVAVIGATEKPGSVGRTLLLNLTSHPFGGTVFPVNPKYESVLGLKAYPRLSALPGRVDLAVIATPAATVPDLISECVAADVKGAIILSAGFKETGAEGAQLEQQILSRAREGKLRIIGPNCLGVMNPRRGLNATAELHLLSVVNSYAIGRNGNTVSYPFIEVPEQVRKSAELYLERVVQKLQHGPLARLSLKISASTVISPDVPGTILQHTNRGPGYDFMAMATHGRSGVPRLLLGSVTEQLLDTTMLPMLVVRPYGVDVPEEASTLAGSALS